MTTAHVILILLGLLAFGSGPILGSRFFAQPLYDAFLSWDVESPPEDWHRARDRHFRLNVIRGLVSRSLPGQPVPTLAI